MAQHTSSAAASSRSRRLRRAVITAMLLAAPLAAQVLVESSAERSTAQVFVWRDASGAVHFSPDAH